MSSSKPLNEVVADLEAGLAPAPNAGFLGASLDPAEAALVVLPVPWEVTVSHGGGTAGGPAAILRASHQLDLEDRAFDRPYRAGIAWLPEDIDLHALNRQAHGTVRWVTTHPMNGSEHAVSTNWVNEAGARLNESVYQTTTHWLDQDKLVCIVGGDHSSSYGLIKALCERHPEGIGVLHLDAHHDLHDAYEGFRWSHASIMRNVMEDFAAVDKLVSVGIRDYSREEARYALKQGDRISTFYADDIYRDSARGQNFSDLTGKILASLPQQVYISVDIDALDPPYCPNTGTPVPGGFSYDQLGFLLEELAASGRKVIGFDLCEVAPGKDHRAWDANVGARLLYRLCGCLLSSQGLI
jgi:agmatinase